METVSEKNPRGRPRKYGKYEGDRFYLEEYVRYESDPTRGVTGERASTTTRHQQNIILAQWAKDRIEAFGEEYPSEHYELRDGCVTPTTERGWFALELCEAPQRVLTELGRLEDEATFRRWVDWYAEEGCRLTAAAAARIIRRERLNR